LTLLSLLWYNAFAARSSSLATLSDKSRDMSNELWRMVNEKFSAHNRPGDFGFIADRSRRLCNAADIKCRLQYNLIFLTFLYLF